MAIHPIYKKFIDTELVCGAMDDETRELAIMVKNLKNSGPVEEIFYYIKENEITQSFLEERNYGDSLEKFRAELYESTDENAVEKLKQDWIQTSIAKNISPITLSALERIVHEFSDGLRERSTQDIKKLIEEISYTHLEQKPNNWRNTEEIKNLQKAGWKLE